METNKKVKIPHEAIARVIREHAEMVRLLEAFPSEIEEINAWIKKKKQIVEKVTKKPAIPPKDKK
ncbi:MAG: hypothetical protein KDK36_12080 [Leptospiraceae bacterium]|nr:hypothetical protein [Leptospiraceae bacterium]